uniref:Capsid protein n=1 Tax=Reticulitermes flavipes permutotetra-like virus 1 TaxID=3133507 RepID=A0AAT9JA32_9VIRU
MKMTNGKVLEIVEGPKPKSKRPARKRNSTNVRVEVVKHQGQKARGSRGSRNRVRKGGGGRPEEAPVSRNVKVHSAQQRSLRLTGSDRILFVENIALINARSIVASVPVVPGIFSRLKEVASVFHRIKYVRLMFKVVPQMGTATSGGYMLGFVKDVTEEIPDGEDGLRALFAQEGTVAASDWQPSTLRVAKLPDLYYTEWNDSEPRWSSPGKLVLATDGKATIAGSVSVYCDYTVTLHEPEAEAPKTPVEATSLVTKEHCGFKSGTRNIGLGNNWGNDHDKAAWQAAIPGLKENTIYRVETPRYALTNLSTNPILRQVTHVRYQSDGYMLPIRAWTEGTTEVVWGTEAEWLTFHNTEFAHIGTIFHEVKPKESLNLIKGSRFVCQMHRLECLQKYIPHSELPRAQVGTLQKAGNLPIKSHLPSDKKSKTDVIQLLRHLREQDLSKPDIYMKLQELLSSLSQESLQLKSFLTKFYEGLQERYDLPDFLLWADEKEFLLSRSNLVPISLCYDSDSSISVIGGN